MKEENKNLLEIHDLTVHYVTDEFINYVRPLIQGDVSPVMVDGIPRYLYHKKK